MGRVTVGAITVTLPATAVEASTLPLRSVIFSSVRRRVLVPGALAVMVTVASTPLPAAPAASP